jgi:hypothetical protein
LTLGSYRHALVTPDFRLSGTTISGTPPINSKARMCAPIQSASPWDSSCLGILRLGKQYSSQRLEAAARRAIALQACSYQSVKSILQRNLDSQSIEPAALPKPPLDHPNIRGSEYFDTDEPPTLQ